MKKMNINLSDLSGKDLSDREKLSIRGGDEPIEGNCCECGCCYAGEPGGSGIVDNMGANYDKGKYSTCSEVGNLCVNNYDPVYGYEDCGTCGYGGGGYQ